MRNKSNILMLNACNNSEIFKITNKGLLKPYDFYGVKIFVIPWQFPLLAILPTPGSSKTTALPVISWCIFHFHITCWILIHKGNAALMPICICHPALVKFASHFVKENEGKVFLADYSSPPFYSPINWPLRKKALSVIRSIAFCLCFFANLYLWFSTVHKNDLMRQLTCIRCVLAISFFNIIFIAITSVILSGKQK